MGILGARKGRRYASIQLLASSSQSKRKKNDNFLGILRDKIKQTGFVSSSETNNGVPSYIIHSTKKSYVFAFIKKIKIRTFPIRSSLERVELGLD